MLMRMLPARMTFLPAWTPQPVQRVLRARRLPVPMLMPLPL
jgi:hypothetical protein